MADEPKQEDKKETSKAKSSEALAKEEKTEVKLSANLQKIVDEIEKLSVLEVAELVKALEEKFGVSAQAPVAVAAAGAAPAAGAAAAPVEEKTEFDVVLASAGANKIGVIKAVR
jgi:large subunit ribosomal protein L7/L12